MPYGMFGSPTPSPTDAAALGMSRPSNGGMGMGMGMGMGGQTNNVFNNPMAAPMLYGSMYPMTPRQQGFTMLAGQSQMLGIGSGQLSGVRAPSQGRPSQQASSRPRGSASQPGGLASRYFHRNARATPQPQSYYNRQNRYFPQVAR
jgi:hypothetical protein